MLLRKWQWGEERSDEFILDTLSRKPYIVQMNFVALACIDLRLSPLIKGERFARVDDPYRAENMESLGKIDGVCREAQAFLLDLSAFMVAGHHAVAVSIRRRPRRDDFQAAMAVVC